MLEIQQAEDFSQGIYVAIAKIDEALSTTSAPAHPLRVTPPTVVTAPAGGVAPAEMKLPKLELAHFDGDLTKWMSFWDTYKVAVHDNGSLSPIQKFAYLKSALSGTAEEAIKGLSLTAANYTESIVILERRFGNKQQIVDKHMDALLHLEAVISANDVSSLRYLYDNVESHIRGLRGLGVVSGTYGSLLTSVLLGRLPKEVSLIISRAVPEDQWTLDKLMEAFETELKARERSTAVLTRGTITTPKKKVSSLPPTGAALLSGVGRSDTGCCYCQRNHSSESCRTVSQVEARKKSLRNGGRCFVCLRRGHISRECRSGKRCHLCGGKHHVSICFKDKPGPQTGVGTESAAPSQDDQTSPPLNHNAPAFKPTTTMYVESGRTALLQTAVANVFNTLSKECVEVLIVLDPGSQCSYITESARAALDLPTQRRKPISIAAFGAKEAVRRVCDVVTIGIATEEGTSRELSLLVVPFICEPLSSPSIRCCLDKYPHLTNLRFASPLSSNTSREPDVLIGSDYYWELVTGETIRGNGGPVAVKTRLGWVLSGPVSFNDSYSSSNLITHVLKVDTCDIQDNLEGSLKRFWDLESIGIHDNESTVATRFTDSIVFHDGRYEVTLPWKDPEVEIPDNYNISHSRLVKLYRRLCSDPETLKMYDNVITEQMEKGIVEVVNDIEVTEGTRIHYLPHHAVVRQDKCTTKLRVVYDASARGDGPSLNDSLHVGPKFNQKILNILLRFCSYRIALAADIEKAFLMISVSRRDRDALRFLWYKNATGPNPELMTLRFARVVFGVASSPFLLNATIRYHLEQYIEEQPHLVKCLLQSIYVDDVLCGAQDEEEAYTIFEQSKEILKRGGFNLRKFLTNQGSLQRRIDEIESPKKLESDQESYARMMLGNSRQSVTGETKVLGIRWDRDGDCLLFDLQHIAATAELTEPTRRHVVGIVSMIYDPMGMLAPFVIKLKMFLQDICAVKLSWDHLLSMELLHQWSALVTELRDSTPIKVSRFYMESVPTIQTYRLCGFSDASKRAYAAVVYLLLDTGQQKMARLVTAKTRVSPEQSLTIPRLELLAALLLARLISSVSESLEGNIPLDAPMCWTDSKVALYWIKGVSKSWKPFVQNRVNEIRKLVPVSLWKHCSGTTNPADLPSRGLSFKELSNSRIWFDGPEWLTNSNLEEETPVDNELPQACIDELRPSVSKGLLIVETSSVANIIDIDRCSTLNKLLHVTSLVLQFVFNCRSQANSDISVSTLMDKAEVLWLQSSQSILIEDKRMNEWKRQFQLFQDQNRLWRCGGRISKANLPYNAVHPILLPTSHKFTTLVVQWAHERVLHNGTKETLSELRSKYWVVKGRSIVRKFINHCVICRRYGAPPYKIPPPPPLPSFRVEEQPPFTFVGVDFAGPVHVKLSDRCREAEKAWIALYTVVWSELYT